MFNKSIVFLVLLSLTLTLKSNVGLKQTSKTFSKVKANTFGIEDHFKNDPFFSNDVDIEHSSSGSSATPATEEAKPEAEKTADEHLADAHALFKKHFPETKTPSVHVGEHVEETPKAETKKSIEDQADALIKEHLGELETKPTTKPEESRTAEEVANALIKKHLGEEETVPTTKPAPIVAEPKSDADKTIEEHEAEINAAIKKHLGEDEEKKPSVIVAETPKDDASKSIDDRIKAALKEHETDGNTSDNATEGETKPAVDHFKEINVTIKKHFGDDSEPKKMTETPVVQRATPVTSSVSESDPDFNTKFFTDNNDGFGEKKANVSATPSNNGIATKDLPKILIAQGHNGANPKAVVIRIVHIEPANSSKNELMSP